MATHTNNPGRTKKTQSLMLVDDFRPYRESACLDLQATLPKLKISSEGDFSQTIARLKSERPEILVLDLHGPNGVAEGLMVLQTIVNARIPPMKIIINSGEHAAEIRDAFARSLQLLGPAGKRIMDSVAIVVLAKGQDDLPQAVKRMQLLKVPKRRGLRQLGRAISDTLNHQKKYDRGNAYLAAELDQYAQLWLEKLNAFTKGLTEVGLAKLPLNSYLKMNTPSESDFAEHNFSKEFASNNSLITARHFYDNTARSIHDALDYHDNLALKPFPKLEKEKYELLILTEEFQDKMHSSKHRTGLLKYALATAARSRYGDKLEGHIENQGLKSLASTHLQVSVSFKRALCELITNSFKAYGAIEGNKVEDSKLSDKTKVLIAVEKVPAEQVLEMKNKLARLKLEKDEIVLKVTVSDQAGGLKIPLAQALQEGESTFGTAGMGMSEVCGILDRNRCVYEFSSSNIGFTTTMYIVGIEFKN